MTKKQTKGRKQSQQDYSSSQKTKIVKKRNISIKDQNKSQNYSYQLLLQNSQGSSIQNDHQIPDCVLLGQTGNGKSTIVNYLCSENPLKYSKNKGGQYYILKNKVNGPQISNSSTSCTEKSRLYVNQKDGLRVRDTAGFNCTKGHEAQLQETISNITQINNSIQQGKPLRIIYVITYSDTKSGRGGIIVESLNKICKIFANSFAQLKQCFAIAINKVDLRDQVNSGYFMRWLKDIDDNNGNLTQQSKQLLRSLKAEQLIIFPFPDQLQKSLLIKIKNQFKKLPSSKFQNLVKLRYSENTQNYLKKKMDQMNDRIKKFSDAFSQLLKKRCQSVETYYNSLITGRIQQTLSRHSRQAIHENNIRTLQNQKEQLINYYITYLVNLPSQYLKEYRWFIQGGKKMYENTQLQKPALLLILLCRAFFSKENNQNCSVMINAQDCQHIKKQLYLIESEIIIYNIYFQKYCKNLSQFMNHKPFQNLKLKLEIIIKVFEKTREILSVQILQRAITIEGRYVSNLNRRIQQERTKAQLQKKRQIQINRQKILHQIKKSLIQLRSQISGQILFYQIKEMITQHGFSIQKSRLLDQIKRMFNQHGFYRVYTW